MYIFIVYRIMTGYLPMHQLRLIVYPIIYQGFGTIQTVVGNGISEASTVWINVVVNLHPPMGMAVMFFCWDPKV